MSNKWDRSSWVSLVPNGLSHTKPNHYLDMAKVAWKNRDQIPFAWRILTRGVCDGCALGTSGLHDYTMEGIHLCMVRLEMLRLNTMPALDVTDLLNIGHLQNKTAAELRELGRLPYPMVRRRGEAGFSRVPWDEAIQLAGARILSTAPDRCCFYLTSRGITNESYYVAQKVARFLGTNNVDNSARLCHAPSTVALKQSLGVAASTCSYRDWIGSNLLVFFGSNTPNNQPVTMKYIYYAKKHGTRVAVINPYREPGFEHYWVPSVTESALFGTKIADAFFQVNIGGDIAFIAGVLKHLIERGWTDEQFIREQTVGFEELKGAVESYSWELLEAESGTNRLDMLRFARMLAESSTAVFVWSMGITQHRNGVANVRAIADLALARGFVGREKSGLMAIRGHSGVQGGAEVGAVPTQFPGGVPVSEESARRIGKEWGFEVPSSRGLNAAEMIEAAHASAVDVFYQAGGNFLETLPDPEFVRQAVARVPVRIHQDIVVTPQMLVEPRDTVVLLPGQTRYEQRGGGTETTTERRILFSPEIPGRRIGESLPEWEIFMRVAEAAYPERASLIHFDDAQAIRNEIARVAPLYEGIQHLKASGDHVQWGGERLCEQPGSDSRPHPSFPTLTGKASFSSLRIQSNSSNGRFRLTTRRGKQFNSMVYSRRDPLNGAQRDDVLISESDAATLGLVNGDLVVVRSAVGEMRGRCLVAPLTPGNVEVHWPEGNALIEREVRDFECGIPDYNAWVEVCRAG